MGERILVVDDEETLCAMLQFFLAKEGYCVDTAESVEAAVEEMQSNEYQILLIDKNMPGIDGNNNGGIDLLRHVRSAGLCPAVIMMTGNPTEETTAQAMELGVACFMSKPFSLLELRQKINTLLSGADSLQSQRLESSPLL